MGSRIEVVERAQGAPPSYVEDGAGTVLGGVAQMRARRPCRGRLVVGPRTVFREYVTVHRPENADAATRIGADCFLMGGRHVAHDCELGDGVTATTHEARTFLAFVRDGSRRGLTPVRLRRAGDDDDSAD